MKKQLILMLAGLLVFGLSACSNNEATAKTPEAPTTNADIAPAAAQNNGSTGSVVETMNAAGYTYVLVDNGSEKIWAAAPEFSVKVGDEVVVPAGMAMHNYHSKSLDRDFDVVYFVESVLNASDPSAMAPAASAAAMQMPAGHPPISGLKAPEELDLQVAKADGGKTIGEIYAAKSDLSGKEVILRGKVVKFSPNIMGTNWIHVQDGSGKVEEGSNDLTVTSHEEVKVGDTLLVKGVLTLDKDFGYGYKYDLIMEDAGITVE